jgi:hypothetical protein
MAYLGNGIYDLLDVIKASKDPSIAYEGLYQDPRRYDTTYYGGDLKTYPYGMTDASGAQALISSAFPQEYGVGSLFNPRVGRPEQSLDYNYQPDFSFRPQGLSQQFKFLPEAYNQSEDVEQVAQIQGPEKRGFGALLESALPYLPFGEKSLLGYLGDKILPKESPEIKGMKSFYRNEYGLDPVGRVASGIMKGYNPVSGGLLNMITGGKYGKPTQFGLAGAMQKRIEDILGRRAAQTDASRAKVEELRNLQLKEMQDRSDRGESLSSIGKSTFSGKGKAFEAKPSGAYSKGFAGGR